MNASDGQFLTFRSGYTNLARFPGCASEVSHALGLPAPFAHLQPQLAAGIATNAAVYAGFLQRIMRGELKMAALLGANATCTNPASCATAVSSPAVGLDWGYSVGHWVESVPAGDGAFSSAGAFGFYPWLSADKTLYGILARQSLAGGGIDSAKCGALIRKACNAGIAQ